MLLVGARSNDLPGMLTLLADYYQRQHLLWTRLKGLMTYPAIVLLVGFLSDFLSIPEEEYVRDLRQRVPPKFLELNLKAFARGRQEARARRFSKIPMKHSRP